MSEQPTGTEAKKWRQGEVNPETGLLFWCRQKSCKDGLRWVTQEVFSKKREAIKIRAASIEGRKVIAKRRNTDKEREKRNAYARVRRNSKSVKEKAAAYARKRRATNTLACIAGRLRARTNEAIRGVGFSKWATTKDILGCSWEELMDHIESLFLPGMNWENRDKWHLDHKIPLASAGDIESLTRLCHYTNIQPLWAKQNQSKGNKIA